MYIKCIYCLERIKADTDDNYNIDHTEICCSHCNRWQPVEPMLEEE